MAVTRKQADTAKEAVKRRLANHPDVTGIGITRRDGEYAVKVNLARESAARTMVPHMVRGVAVVFDVTGQIRPLLPDG